MNIEERLRSGFARRTDEVQVSPGALFEIQRRVRRRQRLPAVRLRPALVLAAAACAAIAVAISLSVTGPDAAPPIQTETPPVAGPADPPAAAPVTPDPPPAPEPQTSPPAVTPPDPQQDGSGQITTATPSTPPAPQAAATPAPPPDPAAAADPEEGTESVTTETPACPAEPASDGSGADSSPEWVTVYFACGDSDAAPRQRAAAANDLATALEILLSGPDESDVAAGFRGLSGNSATAAATTTDDRWVTIDLPAGLAAAFSTDVGEVTVQQFLTQLNATVFQFPDVQVAEYRLDGNCAAFGTLVDGACEIHTRDGDGYAGHTSELTAHTIGDVDSLIRAEPDDGATELGFLPEGSRLTDRRAGSGSDTWAEVFTTAGDRGWVSTETIVAQPLSIGDTARRTMASLARQLTTGPGLEPASFLPAGLVLRWGADDGDVAVVSTAGAGSDSDWWYRSLSAPSPRDGSSEASLADLMWIDGGSDGAMVTINAPGPLGEPHGDFASLAYVSIYRPSVDSSILPPELGPAPGSATTTTQAQSSEESDLPPALPTPVEDPDETDDAEQPDPLRAQISVIFDFLSPAGPRIAAVEAIWIQP